MLLVESNRFAAMASCDVISTYTGNIDDSVPSIVRTKTGDASTCLYLCQQHTDCVMVQWQRTGACTLYDVLLSSEMTIVPASATMTYEFICGGKFGQNISILIP